jgi:hypothetical protein
MANHVEPNVDPAISRTSGTLRVEYWPIHKLKDQPREEVPGIKGAISNTVTMAIGTSVTTSAWTTLFRITSEAANI